MAPYMMNDSRRHDNQWEDNWNAGIRACSNERNASACRHHRTLVGDNNLYVMGRNCFVCGVFILFLFFRFGGFWWQSGTILFRHRTEKRKMVPNSFLFSGSCLLLLLLSVLLGMYRFSYFLFLRSDRSNESNADRSQRNILFFSVSD